MAYVQDNSNPVARRVTDCAVRAVGYALGIDWETAYFLIAINGASMGDMMERNSVWGSVLRQAGYKRRELPSNCPDCYTVADFAADHPNGTFILVQSGQSSQDGHVVTLINGNWIDTWDCGSEIVEYYWYKED